MPDENLMKSILDAHERLQPYIDAAEAARRCIQPFDIATLRVIEQSKGIEEMLKKLSLFDTRACAPLLKEPEWAKQIREVESRFRLPHKPEIVDLMSKLAVGPVAKLLNQNVGLQRAMEDLQAPWLEVTDEIRSLTGFSELQSIGVALANVPTFDENLAKALRCDLGDWRETISWKPEIFADWKARSAFYESVGFNKALTGFPTRAFEQSLDIAHLRDTVPTLVLLYGDPLLVEKDTEDPLVTPHTAYRWLFGLETQLRAFIDQEMQQAFGPDWPKHRLPNGLYEKWVEKRNKAVQAGGTELPLIAYADFTDYELVICKRENWRVVFTGFFRRLESVRESLQRLYPIRICAMHARPTTKDDELLLYVEAKRLRKAFKR